MDLADFLLTRIAEDGKSLWCGLNAHADHPPYCRDPDADCDWREKREWSVKQRIVEAASRTFDVADPTTRSPFEQGWDYLGALILRDLGTVYADHPDYCDKWRP
jgi:hypothetical protein